MEAIEVALARVGIRPKGKLAHFGVKGMRWGVIGGASGGGQGAQLQGKSGMGMAKKPMPVKTVAGDNRRAVFKQKPVNKPTGFAKRPPKDVKSMSDQELKKIIARINMEKQFKDLTAPQQNTAKKYVKDLLIKMAKEQAEGLARQGAAELTKQIIKKSGPIIIKQAVKAAAKS